MTTRIFKPRLTLLDGEGIRELHGAAVRILETTGLNVHHPEMQRLLADRGARPGSGERVFLPAAMIEQALRTARRDVVVHDRNGRPAMPLRPHRIYFGTGSDLLYTRDPDGRRRPASLADVGRAARLCDALPEVDFVMSFGLPNASARAAIEPAQYDAMIRNTVKPVLTTSFTGLPSLKRLHAMATRIAGGDAAFRQRPNYVLYGQFVSPLQHDTHAVERLIFCARQEVPLIYIPTIMPGASGPVTLAGSLALAVAECLAGLVMHQACRPGAPFIFGACVSPLDLQTLHFPYGSAEWRLNDLAMAEMARHYGLPVFGTGGASDAKSVDAQAGAEAAQSLLVAALAGTNLIHDIGYLDSGAMGSLASIVLAADAIRWTKHFLTGLEVSEETLALDPIRQVGPGRQFLDHAHTLAHFRQTLMAPYAAVRHGYERWVEEGSQTYEDRARHCAEDLLQRHPPRPLAGALDRDLKRLLRAAS